MAGLFKVPGEIPRSIDFELVVNHPKRTTKVRRDTDCKKNVKAC